VENACQLSVPNAIQEISASVAVVTTAVGLEEG